jgi:hypothetical protein
MVGPGELQKLTVDEIELDRSNPRIRKFLEMYPDPTPEQFFQALGSPSDDEGDGSAKFEQLKNSILTNRGIIQPILVNRTADGRLVCVEGNTRVALYKHFIDEKAKGDWTQIPALVWDNMDSKQVDAIRLQVHLVGTRAWDPYSKAKYLHHLRTQELLPFSEVVDYCGGRKKEVVELIEAYDDMEKYYRPVATDQNFDVRRFSGFVELQRQGTKEAILEAGFSLTDFAEWIHTGKLYPLYTVRSLRRILRNDKAREVFLKHGAKKAMEVVDKPDISDALGNANMTQLAKALSHRVYNLPWPEAQLVREDPSSESAQVLHDLVSLLHQLLGVTASEE